jgi:hypothetical protein
LEDAAGASEEAELAPSEFSISMRGCPTFAISLIWRCAILVRMTNNTIKMKFH